MGYRQALPCPGIPSEESNLERAIIPQGFTTSLELSTSVKISIYCAEVLVREKKGTLKFKPSSTRSNPRPGRSSHGCQARPLETPGSDSIVHIPGRTLSSLGTAQAQRYT